MEINRILSGKYINMVNTNFSDLWKEIEKKDFILSEEEKKFYEKEFIKNAYYCFMYSKYVKKSRWFEAEEILARLDSYIAFQYSLQIIKGRFKLIENSINYQLKIYLKHNMFFDHQ